MEYDAFISHASEDKEIVARPLAKELTRLGYKIWYDEFSLKMGDSLRQSINKGLTNSRFAIVILSKSFLNKSWPILELDGLTARENLSGEKVILPVWHKITPKELQEKALPLLDRLAATTDNGLPSVVAKIIEALGEPIIDTATGEAKENRQAIEKALAKSNYTIELYNEWHSEKIRESRIFVSAWTKQVFSQDSIFPNLTKVENEGGQVEYHVFQVIHFFEKWALLAKNEVIDKILIMKLLGSYLVWYETNLIDPLLIADERNQDFKDLLKLIKHQVFIDDIHGQNFLSKF